jgi:glycosyltransferase involved in cell wall biosynthesis
MPHPPLVSVLITVFNSAHYLREAIDSILSQSFKDFELIILNDGSTDESRSIIQSYDDERIKIIDNRVNIGLSRIANLGISLAKGKYIARMDSDDVSIPNRLQLQVDYMEANPDIAVCGGFFKAFGVENSILNFNWVNETDSDRVKINLLFDCAICQPTVFIRNEALKESGLLYNSDYDSAEDYRLWVSLSKNYKVANIPDIILRYRLSPNQTTNKKNHIQRAIKISLIKEQLLSLGIVPSDVELRIHQQMFYGDPIVSYDYLPKMLVWIKRLIQANDVYHIYHDAKLYTYLMEMYTNNERNLKKKIQALTFKDSVLFYTKQLLQWKSIR